MKRSSDSKSRRSATTVHKGRDESSTSGETELAMLNVAELLAELRFVAELSWIDDDTDAADAPALARLLAKARQITDQIDSIDDAVLSERAAKAVRHLASVVEAFAARYRQAWSSSARIQALQHLELHGGVDPEWQFDADCWLLSRWPQAEPIWKDCETARQATLEALDDGLAACFELGWLLACELYPTVTGGERAKERVTLRTYYSVELTRAIRDHLDELLNHYPSLHRLKLPDLDVLTAYAACHNIKRFLDRLRRGLEDPASLRGYLALVLDKRRWEIRRGDQTVSLTQPLRWRVLEILEAGGGSYSSREALERAWPSVGFESLDTLPPVDKAISDLRRVLAPLDITIAGKREVGWRLEPLTKQRQPRSRGRRAGKASQQRGNAFKQS